MLPELWARSILPAIFSSVDTLSRVRSRRAVGVVVNGPSASIAPMWSKKFDADPPSRGGSTSPSRSSGRMGIHEEAALAHEERMLVIHGLHEVLRPFVLRRVKSAVLGQLPEKVRKSTPSGPDGPAAGPLRADTTDRRAKKRSRRAAAHVAAPPISEA